MTKASPLTLIPQNYTWMIFPSWGTGLVLSAAARLAGVKPYDTTIVKLGGGVQLLPDIDTISNAEQLFGITARIGTGAWGPGGMFGLHRCMGGGMGTLWQVVPLPTCCKYR